MNIVAEAFQIYLPLIAQSVVRASIIFVIGLGFVYLEGRMLGIIKSSRLKNLTAFLIMGAASYYSVLIYDTEILVHEWEGYWRAAVYVALAIIFYVLIGFDLYDRFNAWSDKRWIEYKKKRGKKK